jgi:hypothetical protein
MVNASIQALEDMGHLFFGYALLLIRKIYKDLRFYSMISVGKRST